MNTHHYITTSLHYYITIAHNSQLAAHCKKITSIKTNLSFICYIDKRAQQPKTNGQEPMVKNIWWFGLQSRFIAAGGVTKTSPAPPQNQAILNISNPAVISYNEL
ncbi:MAG: hypothetical protein IIX06_00420 [Bacteroidales bacterium]|nr:hypothetical protein [Bacteroidales bacterium]